MLGLLDGLVRARFTRRAGTSSCVCDTITLYSYILVLVRIMLLLDPFELKQISLKIITPTYSTIEGVFTRNQIVYSRSGVVSAPASNQRTGRNVFDRFSKFLPRFSFLRS